MSLLKLRHGSAFLGVLLLLRKCTADLLVRQHCSTVMRYIKHVSLAREATSERRQTQVREMAAQLAAPRAQHFIERPVTMAKRHSSGTQHVRPWHVLFLGAWRARHSCGFRVGMRAGSAATCLRRGVGAHDLKAGLAAAYSVCATPTAERSTRARTSNRARAALRNGEHQRAAVRRRGVRHSWAGEDVACLNRGNDPKVTYTS